MELNSYNQIFQQTRDIEFHKTLKPKYMRIWLLKRRNISKTHKAIT